MSFSNVSFLSSTVNYYLKPITKKEQIGYSLLFAAMVLGSAAVGIAPITFTAVKLAADAVIGAVAYLIIVAAYRSLMLYGVEEKFLGFKPETANATLEFYKGLADRGLVKAQMKMGDLYESSQKDEAIRYYKMASDRGNGSASHSLGQIYENGNWRYKNVADATLAFNYFQLAASQGHISAHITLAFSYSNGDIVKQDLIKALQYMKIAADLGNCVGQRFVAEMYQRGMGCQENHDLAFHYYDLAAKGGHKSALIGLGFCYGLGEKINRIDQEIERLDDEIRSDPKKSLKWRQDKGLELLGQATKNGEKEPWYYMGLIYEKQNNQEMAIKMYSQAEKAGGYGGGIWDIRDKITARLAELQGN